MTKTSSNRAVRAFTVCALVLFLKMFATLSIQGAKSFSAGMRSPEDNQFSMGGMPTQNYGLDSNGHTSDAVLAARAVDFRWKRIVQNDLETIPIGLLVVLGSILAGGNETVNSLVVSLFTLARIAHTVSYAHQLQPHRAICWSIGQLCVLVAGLTGVVAVLTSDNRKPATKTASEKD